MIPIHSCLYPVQLMGPILVNVYKLEGRCKGLSMNKGEPKKSAAPNYRSP